MIVMKFGGSSVESARAIQRVASIVRDHLDRHPVVVVSAMGKTTDRLLAIAQFCAAGNQAAASRELLRLKEFHLREAACLTSPHEAGLIERCICERFEELEKLSHEVNEAGTLSPRLSDAILSLGERLSSEIVTAAFRREGIDATHLDSRTAIVTDRRHTCAALLAIETNALLRRKVSREQVTVMGGFIAATEDGVTTTLGRGGSDYTAAIVGAAISADEIQIWTDVDGMLTCDPRIVPEAHCLRSISYSEAEEMARSGAKVLHPATVLPAIKQRIPIVIRNSRNPAAAGTRVVQDNPSCEGVVMSIACKTGLTLLDVRPRNTPVTSEFGRTIWDAFQESGVYFELVSPAVRQFSLLVETSSLTPAFRSRLSRLAELTFEEDRALITMVGRNTSRNTVNIVRASQRLGRVSGGAMLTCATDSRFAFVVAATSLGAAAAALHREFFSQPDPVLFVPDRCATGMRETSVPRATGLVEKVCSPALS
jgi:aspartate kinase